MYLRSVYIANATGILVLLMLLYSSRAKTLRHHVEDRLYKLMVYGVIIGCLVEALSYSIDGKLFPGARLINHLSNTYLFTMNVLLPFALLVTVDLSLYGDMNRIVKKYRLQIIVGVLMIAANIVNLFVPLVYYISPQNVYERKPFSYVYYAVILYYCISAIVLTRGYERDNGAKAFFNINMFLLPIILGAGLQFLFYGLSLGWLAAAVGLVGLFMMQQNEMAYVDSLTDTYNRQYLNHILSSWISRGNTFVGAMLDVDGFKGINDKYGHSEGDEALKTVADILKRSRLSNEWVFRFAGDEFIVLKMANSANALDVYMSEVNKKLDDWNSGTKPYKLGLSYGISFFDRGMMGSFMKEMDERMYEMKAEHHKTA